MEIIFKVFSVVSGLVGVLSLVVAAIVQFANNAKGLENRIDWNVWLVCAAISAVAFSLAHYLWR